MTRPRFAVIDSSRSAGAGCGARSAMPDKHLHFVEYQSRDLALRRLRKAAVAGGGDESDGVGGRVEADPGLRDVVEDEEVGAFALELRPRAVEAAFARLRSETDDELAVAAPRAERGEDV